jgi:hypothetical protein
MMRALRRRGERGSVLVLTAAAMVPIGMMLGYAIDVSHWFDYSRNLQNRADAAALAGASAFGNICLNGGTPGDTTNGAQSAIGKWAQLYSGAALGNYATLGVQNLPYRDSDVAAATDTPAGKTPSWRLASDGYHNNSIANPLTLKAGTFDQYHMLLNASNYWDKGGSNFSMNAAGSLATFCNSDPAFDATDVAPFDLAGPMIDVKLTQHELPFFVPFTGIKPDIHAHARVALQGEASSDNIRPIAVRDSGFTPCVSVDFIDATTNAVIKTAVLTKQAAASPSDPPVWSNPTVQVDGNGNPIAGTGPAAVAIPASNNVYVQPFLNNCNGAGERYNDSGPLLDGMLYINSRPTIDPTVGAGDAPKLTFGTPSGATTPIGVALTGTCTSDQYFSTGDCNVQMNAYVKFASNINRNQITIFAVDHTWDPVTSAFVTSAPVTMNDSNAVPTLWTSGNITIGDQTGLHQFEITYKQIGGSIGPLTCGNGNGGNPPPCTGSFGIQTQGFGACNGCDPPDDSGPISLAQLRRSSDAAGTFGMNSLPQGTTQNLVVTLRLSGLAASKPGDPATILRYSASGTHQTGLIDCGQGSGANADVDVIYYGCGPSNPNFSPPLNPLFVNARNGLCTQPWPNGDNQDCVQTTPGQRRQAIPCTIVLRITTQPLSANCTGGAGACPATLINHWTPAYNYNIPGGDPRALTFIVTSQADLAAGAGSPQAWIPIRRFATFYVTGWDKAIKPQCADNEAFPGKGKNTQNAAIWGHWIAYVDPAGIGNGQPCDPSQFLQNCVGALTR